MNSNISWLFIIGSFLFATPLKTKADVMLKLSPPEVFKPYLFKIIGGTPMKFGHDDGARTNALFGATTGLAIDGNGNIYVADGLLGGQTIRKLAPDGMVTTIAGASGDPGEKDGQGTEARLYQPYAVVADTNGNLYVADSYGATIRKVTPEGVVTTLAGVPFIEGSTDGTGTNALFKYPTGIAIDLAGNLYVADQDNHTIRRVTLLGEVTTIAGMPLVKGTNDGFGTAARFSSPRALTVARDGNLYVADSGNNTIRKVTTNGVTSTLAGAPDASSRGIIDGTGSGARFGLLTGIAADSADNLYVIDAYNYAIRKITPEGVVSTLLDQDGFRVRFKFGGDDSSIAIDKDDNLYVADAGDSTILKADRAPDWLAINVSAISSDPFSANGNAIVEASTDLETWIPIETNLSYNGYAPTRALDTNAASFPYRFYRTHKQ
jgi:sugar lactone lactonase YvrE